MKNYGFLVTTAHFKTAFRTREEYADAWRRLQSVFPVVRACVLMPDHVHLALATDDPGRESQRLALALNAHARQFRPGERIWNPVEKFEPISNAKHLWRYIRYVHLNPPRDGLVHDPLEWEWSTHRDAMGAVSPLWMSVRGVDRERFHRYVSSDPSVEVTGTPAPRALVSVVANLTSIGTAVLRATRRAALGIHERKLYVHLARRVGNPRREDLAKHLGISARRVSAWKASELGAPEEAQLRAAWLVLSDQRLLVSPKRTISPSKQSFQGEIVTF